MGTPGVHAPARLGRYELLARLATGGMGEIFLARLEGAAGFEKLYVVKRILPHLADDARFRAMLIAEARIASKMAHANICQVYELGETDGQLYIVMEYLEGIALLPLLRKASKGGMTLELGLIGGIVQQCCDALHYAHELRDRNNELLGIVHRDVTPGNIFLTESGMAKLLDFGIAKVKDASPNTQTGTVKGKYAYMAPEQLRGGAIDRRADVFALGIVIYELLALRRLFQRKTDYLTFRAVMEQPIPDVRRYRADVPDALAELITRAIDRDPEQRPATARQLGASVLDALGVRAWSQNELGDFVQAHFGDELGQRRAEATDALHASQPERLSVSLLGADVDALEDDDDFPAVDSAITAAPPDLRARDFAGQTPPPFAADSNASGQHLALRGPSLSGTGSVAALSGNPPQMVVVAAKRSLVWPLLAIAMVGISATALFLVWKTKQQPAPAIIVEKGPAPEAPGNPPSDPPRGDPGRGSEPAGPAGSGSAPAGTPRGGGSIGSTDDRPRGGGTNSRPKPGTSTNEDYNRVINAFRPKMNICVRENPLPPGAARVVIVVAPDGSPRTVSLEPASLDSTPGGLCIKRLLSAAQFPRAKEALTVTVPVSVTAKSL